MQKKKDNTYPPLLETRKKAAALAVLIIAAALLAYLFFATAEYRVSMLFPDCMLRTATGIKCFLCGGTRCARALMNGDIVKAFYYNPFIVLCGIFAAVCYVRLVISIFKKNYEPLRINEKYLWAVLIGVLLFSAVRNFDFYQKLFY